jgi:DNA-binding response OmpR family regulator
MSELPISLGGQGVRSPKPLFGVTILLVEDSRSASEALRLFATESGARLRRADSIASASRHLAIFRPNAVVVDLGLPDGNGLALIVQLVRAPVPYEAVIATSGGEPGTWEAAAAAAGAAACLPKPVPSLRAFQDCIATLLPDRATAPAAGAEPSLAAPASVREALEADLARALALLDAAVPAGDAETIAYCAQFLASMGEAGREASRLAIPELGREEAMLGGAALIAHLRARLGHAAEARGAA